MMSWLIQKVYADGHGSGANPIAFENPLRNIDSVEELIVAILNVVVQIGLPIIVLMIVYVGFLFVTARGSDDKLIKAKSAFLWTVVGAGIVLGAQVIATAINQTVTNL